MADAGARGIKVHAVVVRELLDLGVLAEVLRGDVLDVVVDRKDRLMRIGDLRVLARGFENLPVLRNHRACVVMGHDMLGTDGDESAAADDGAGWESDGVEGGEFFDGGEGHGRILQIRGYLHRCAVRIGCHVFRGCRCAATPGYAPLRLRRCSACTPQVSAPA